MSNFYVVATPIGNLEDITLRAINILKQSDLIVCEDTSNAQKLLKHYGIDSPTTVYFSNSKLSHIDKIIKTLESDKDVSLISDAGTPAISDPGSLLIREIRNKLQDKVKIIPIPGASAVTAIFSVAGVFGNSFSFLGFIPQKKGRETFLKDILIEIENRPVIFYESVHRVEKLFEQMIENSFENINIIIGRELTKIHEEVISGDIQSVKEYFVNNKDHVRGEFVILVSKIK